MRHFNICTSLTLATDESTEQMRHITVAHLAYQHEFLMQALLACTELHIAYLNPGQRLNLTTSALTRQGNAFTLFRAAVPTLEKDNCDAAIVFARLITITSFALEERSVVGREVDDKLPNWLFFIRSGCE
jgi:hypothetical protein